MAQTKDEIHSLKRAAICAPIFPSNAKKSHATATKASIAGDSSSNIRRTHYDRHGKRKGHHKTIPRVVRQRKMKRLERLRKELLDRVKEEREREEELKELLAWREQQYLEIWGSDDADDADDADDCLNGDFGSYGGGEEEEIIGTVPDYELTKDGLISAITTLEDELRM